MDLDDLTHAQAAVGELLGSLEPADWERPSPCADWDVAAVARHLVVGERVFATSLGGTPYDLPAVIGEVDGVAVTDLPEVYGEGARGLREALAHADPAGTFPTGLGPMPAPAIAQLRTIEALTHGWDIARGAGSRLVVADAVAERAIAHSLALMERLPPGRTPFGPPRPVADDASAIDRLAALLGREGGQPRAR
jgi:uncharacterized protein (TIGR03086 family)